MAATAALALMLWLDGMMMMMQPLVVVDVL
jgi:hypothetical protein